MRLKNLPVDARPLEKLLARGAAALSETELLALMLRSCIHCKNILQLVQELMKTFGCVACLLHATAGALESIKGLALVHVQVLDHFVVTRTKAVSMAELGLV